MCGALRDMSKSISSLLSAILLLGFTACGHQEVRLLEPKDGDLVVLNGCVVSACNYLAVTKAKHTLEPNYWAKILLVRFQGHPAGHAYCVWETDGTIYGYDRNSGGFPLPIYTREPQAIAAVLAKELGNILKESLTVQSAEFVEPNKSKLFAYSLTPAPARPPALLSTASVPAGVLGLGDSAPPGAKK